MQITWILSATLTSTLTHNNKTCLLDDNARNITRDYCAIPRGSSVQVPIDTEFCVVSASANKYGDAIFFLFVLFMHAHTCKR